MRVVVVTDAWFPQTNGVVRTLATTVDRMRADGIEVHVLVAGRIPHRAMPDVSRDPAGGEPGPTPM